MKLHFKKEGQGSPIVIVHGLYGSSDNWLAISKRLSDHHQVYAIDLRNHGRSPHHPEHTYQGMVDDLARFFDDHHIERATLLGHSMGGKTAMLFAADYPERVEKLVIADIAPKDYLRLGDESQYHLHRTILMAMMEINFEFVKTRQDVADSLAEKIGSPDIIQFLLKNVAVDTKSKKLHWRLNVEALYNHLEEIVEGGNEKYFEDRLPVTVYPVVFIRGLKSPYIRDEDIPRILRIYPDAQIIDIPDAGHWLHAEQPELFMQAVLQCC
ncbi:pimeloyl-ACP methyl ester carboxylesterase [Bacteroidales bacterium 6E]|nr:pimeloyl-ACP methyl ester carboxylesterase [Bacteroidales bacterium 6E]